MFGSARAPAQAVRARQSVRDARKSRTRSSAGRVSAKKDDYVPGMYISQSQMELRMLEKLLKDKRKELAAYDLQLEEYMKIVASTQRNMTPGTLRSSTPTAGAITARSSASASLALSAKTGTPQATQDILDRLLDEKQTELLRLQQDVAMYKQEVAGSSYALSSTAGALGTRGRAPPAPANPDADARAKRLSSMSEFARLRLAELEGEMASDLKATREQIRRNDELKAQNDIQLRANEALARELMTDKSQRMADTFSVPSGVASQIANAKAVEAAMAKAGVKPIPLPPLNMPPPGAPRPPPPPASAAPKMISPTPASEEAASNFRRALAEQPSLFEEAAAAEPEPAFSTAALDESVAKSSATSRAAAAYTEPGLGKNKRSSWGPEVVLMAAAAAVEAAVDFATTTFEESLRPKATSAVAAPTPTVAAVAAPPKPTEADVAAKEEEVDEPPNETLAETVAVRTEGEYKVYSFSQRMADKRKKEAAAKEE